MSRPKRKVLTPFTFGFLDGFGMAGLFRRLKVPGTATQMFAEPESDAAILRTLLRDEVRSFDQRLRRRDADTSRNAHPSLNTLAQAQAAICSGVISTKLLIEELCTDLRLPVVSDTPLAVAVRCSVSGIAAAQRFPEIKA